MNYFGGGGVQGDLHPSLRTYIDCVDAPLVKKEWPRGGSIWEQDPVLVRDFRTIRKFELDWKRTQEQLKEANPGEGQSEGLEAALDQYIQQLEENDNL